MNIQEIRLKIKRNTSITLPVYNKLADVSAYFQYLKTYKKYIKQCIIEKDTHMGLKFERVDINDINGLSYIGNNSLIIDFRDITFDIRVRLSEKYKSFVDIALIVPYKISKHIKLIIDNKEISMDDFIRLASMTYKFDDMSEVLDENTIINQYKELTLQLQPNVTLELRNKEVDEQYILTISTSEMLEEILN